MSKPEDIPQILQRAADMARDETQLPPQGIRPEDREEYARGAEKAAHNAQRQLKRRRAKD